MSTTLDSILNIRLYQPMEGYRFSMDSVLLYSFVNLRKVESIIDIGAGSGVVGLLLAKKYPSARVTLVELQKNLHELAVRNVALNGLEERVTAVMRDIKAVDEGLGRYELAVSNPPFRKERTGLLSARDERAIARHELELPLHELLSAASRLLKNRGRFVLVHLPWRLAEVISGLRDVDLEPKRLRFVHGMRGSEAKMVLVEAVRRGREGLKVESPMFVYGEDGSYSEEVRRMYEP